MEYSKLLTTNGIAERIILYYTAIKTLLADDVSLSLLSTVLYYL